MGYKRHWPPIVGCLLLAFSLVLYWTLSESQRTQERCREGVVEIKEPSTTYWVSKATRWGQVVHCHVDKEDQK